MITRNSVPKQLPPHPVATINSFERTLIRPHLTEFWSPEVVQYVYRPMNVDSDGRFLSVYESLRDSPDYTQAAPPNGLGSQLGKHGFGVIISKIIARSTLRQLLIYKLTTSGPSSPGPQLSLSGRR